MGKGMAQHPNDKPYDLEERTFLFAQRVRELVKKLRRSVGNIEDARQLIRASGSVGSNYVEATEGLGRKDFKMHIRISRKESKESRFFLRLLDTGEDDGLEQERSCLSDEASQ